MFGRGLRVFRGIEIFSGGVGNFLGGVEIVSGVVENFREG